MAMISRWLVRYGQVPEVARCAAPADMVLERQQSVVVQTHRGLQIGSVLERARPLTTSPDDTTEFTIIRAAHAEDFASANRGRERAEAEFPQWLARIAEWQLDLDLIDIEWTLDGEKQILYVLTERGPATTNLALQAAAAGLGLIEVQPVAAEGLVTLPSSGGCGSGGCGCHNE
ncbi:hypothetical protein GC163_01320 [bacterium]|nr:hypothetical protein [bacterium]